MHPVWHSGGSANRLHDQSQSGDRISRCRGRRPANAAENRKTRQLSASEPKPVRERLEVCVEQEA
eukprot:6173158-Pleurochrysis_carterae.AAC.2